MKRIVLSFFMLAVVFQTDSNTLAADAPKIDPRVQSQIQTTGRARVFVRLNVPTEIEGNRSPEARQARLKAIIAAHLALLRELDQTEHKVYRRGDVPSADLSMEIGSDALKVFEDSTNVRKVDHVPKLKNPTENIKILP